ncbi:uncharacterized protein K452DRAFT_291017 [Aplosporella prunicola CBS 121167]|uniref:ATP synthase subunit K, mitochondrial n=1 Tax=Aplosporella prunicola CBS 121167 TaxID=1176127 RepID=A0A6A6B3P2_9PEZI|nr:uncharacterized protein K452DRAFT_291017 [Aplosporella prunicola CBS 121167]KAF2137983.1 hypothetical protein K452DRAFT_291017 [Aplosporella prunicola CBS 121167]
MVVYYQIAGRKVGSHVLAMGILGSVIGGISLATGGSKKKELQATPPLNASSKDEENFITDFLKEADKKQ